MGQFAFGIVAGVLIFGSSVLAQASIKPSAASGSATQPPGTDSQFAGYKFSLTIDAEKRTELKIYTGYEYTALEKKRLTSILTDYISMQMPTPGKRMLHPVVSVRPHPAVDLQTVIGVIKAARVSETSRVYINTPDGSSIEVPADPKFTNGDSAAVTPLTLIIDVDASGDISLNKVRSGSLTDFTILTRKLSEIFLDRSKNGVTRPGTDEIEKMVWVRLPLTATVSDLNKVANAINEAGSYRTGLLID